MKKLMIMALGLGLAFGSTFAFAQETKKDDTTATTSKGKKKGGKKRKKKATTDADKKM